MSQIEDLLLRIKGAGISISLSGDLIKLDVPENSNSDTIISEVKRNKPALISYMRQAKPVGGQSAGRPQQVEKRETYEICHQEKKEFLRALILGPHAFNLGFLLSFTALDERALGLTLDTLMDRHESLRTSFHIIDDEPVQIVQDTIPFELVEIPYDADTDAVVGRFIRKFDIAVAPLFRVGVMKLSAERHLFLLDMHHIISDGGSLTLFSRELWELYKDKDRKSVV